MCTIIMDSTLHWYTQKHTHRLHNFRYYYFIIVSRLFFSLWAVVVVAHINIYWTDTKTHDTSHSCLLIVSLVQERPKINAIVSLTAKLQHKHRNRHFMLLKLFFFSLIIINNNKYYKHKLFIQVSVLFLCVSVNRIDNDRCERCKTGATFYWDKFLSYH